MHTELRRSLKHFYCVLFLINIKKKKTVFFFGKNSIVITPGHIGWQDNINGYGEEKKHKILLKQSSSDGAICADKQTPKVLFKKSLFSFFSSDAMQWCVMFGSSLAGHHCLWRLMASVLVTRSGPWINARLYLKGTQRKGITPRNKIGEKTWCYPRKYIYFKTCTLYTAQWLLYKSKPIIRQKSNISLGTVICLFLLFPIAVGGLLLRPIVLLGSIPIFVCMSGVNYIM